jgi:hypothetical protein
MIGRLQLQKSFRVENKARVYRTPASSVSLAGPMSAHRRELFTLDLPLVMMFSLEHQTNFQGQREYEEYPDSVGTFILHAGPPITPVINLDQVICLPNRSPQLICLAGKVLIGPSREWLDTEAVRDPHPIEGQSNEAPKSGDEGYLAEHTRSWCALLWM